MVRGPEIRIAILATYGVERVELEQARGALYGAGPQATCCRCTPARSRRASSAPLRRERSRWTRQVADVEIDEYEALLLPGSMGESRWGCASTATRSASSPPSWPPGTRSRRSAAVRGRSSRPTSSAVTGSRRGPASGPTCATQAPNPSTRRSSSTDGSSPAALPRTWPPPALDVEQFTGARPPN